MPARPVPVRIRGVLYPSIAEAARQLSVSPSGIQDALNRGKLDTVGTRPHHVQVTVDGREYPTIAAAAIAEGFNVTNFYSCLRDMRDQGRMVHTYKGKLVRRLSPYRG